MVGSSTSAVIMYELNKISFHSDSALMITALRMWQMATANIEIAIIYAKKVKKMIFKIPARMF